MSSTSTIEWTEATWNPIRGCTKISPGCKNCYAETFAERFRGVEGHPYEQGFDLRLVPEKLHEPLSWKKPRRIFVNSMSDLFHEDVPFEYIDQVFAVMALAKHHTFQVLTKRAERMREYLSADGREDAIDNIACDMREEVKHWVDFATDYIRLGRGGFVELPLENVWPGVSVENRKHGLPRIEHLRQTPAAVRMLSVEPLLEDLEEIDLTGIGWCIVGCESGHGRRPMKPEWADYIALQCREQGVPFFMKQMEVGGKVTGNVEQFPAGRLRVREYPATKVTVPAC